AQRLQRGRVRTYRGHSGRVIAIDRIDTYKSSSKSPIF
ncbi:hypothetical protein L249_5958, partial [Ophiocordyceps polyrhachis-furcata BCC 54312]